ncbi:hypothetical protein [Anaerotignum sp.]
MYNRRYEKVFLMLRQETAGYALGKRPPWGSCIMELKNGRGKLHLTIQGLKPLPYEVYVMAEEESIFCGMVQPEKKEGRCELKWDFDPNAIGEGKKAEDLHTVILLAEGLSAPLTAYFREKRNWKTEFKPREKEKPAKEEIILQAAEAAVLERPPVVLEKQGEPKDPNTKVAEMQRESYHGSFQGLLAKFRQELEELEETGILSHEETEHIRNMGTETDVETKERAEEPVVQMEEKKREFLFACNRELSPFGDGEKWRQISLEEMILLSQIPLKWQREFFFLLPYRKYHHLILQEKEDGIRLGLPGQFNAADAADAHAFGFHEFRNIEGDWGYWMTFLERNS